MNAKTAFHAKTPQMFFEPDSQSKEQEASDEIHALCAEHLNPLCLMLLTPTNAAPLKPEVDQHRSSARFATRS